MVSKVLFSVLVALAVAQLSVADPALCPNSDTEKALLYELEVHEDAPDSGRVEKVVDIPNGEKPISCIILTATENTASASIVAIGISDAGVGVKVVSAIQQGIDGVVEVYTE